MFRRILVAKFLLIALGLMCMDSMAYAQGQSGEAAKKAEMKPEVLTQQPLALGDGAGSPFLVENSRGRPSGFLTGNQNFPNFIGFLSNPIQSIDPRAVTEIWPMFNAGWVSPNNSAGYAQDRDRT